MKHSIKLNISPTPQKDNHSCGFCALSSIYRYYELSPAGCRLREYLGTNHILPYTFPFRQKIEGWLGGAEHWASGTSPMDLLAVLHWDGFDYQFADSDPALLSSELKSHLDLGHPALCLFPDCLHWVVVSGYTDSGFWIVDSILWEEDEWPDGPRRRIYQYSNREFLSDKPGVVLVWRNETAETRDMQTRDFAVHYSNGVTFAAKTLGKPIPDKIKGLLRVI